MKTLIKLFIIISIYSFSSCSAQTTASLQQMEDCRKRPNKSEDCPGMENVIYVKDIGNRLNKFIGTWKGTSNGKSYELKLEKKENFGNNEVKWDKLIGKLKIKDNQGNILFDSFQNSEADAEPYGYNFQGSAYEMRFSTNNNCGDHGTIFLEIKSIVINGDKMRMFYYPSSGLANNNSICPDLLPLDWTEFTKQ